MSGTQLLMISRKAKGWPQEVPLELVRAPSVGVKMRIRILTRVSRDPDFGRILHDFVRILHGFVAILHDFVRILHDFVRIRDDPGVRILTSGGGHVMQDPDKVRIPGGRVSIRIFIFPIDRASINGTS